MFNRVIVKEDIDLKQFTNLAGNTLYAMNLPASIFNNVIGPVMRGPSSSHTAAAVRIGLLAKSLLGADPVKVNVTFDPHGSLTTTYIGQGSAMGLAAGLLGMEITDVNMTEAEKICLEKGIIITYHIEKFDATHPNTYRLELESQDGKSIKLTALSTGGGIIKLIELDGEKIDDDLDYINPLLPVKISRNPELPFQNIDELTNILKSDGGKLSDFAVLYEVSIGDLTENDIKSLALSYAAIMRSAIETGLAGTEYRDRILHRQSHLISEGLNRGELISGLLTNKIIESVTAIMETKSSMGVIVATPTAGSCGTVGGALLPVAELMGKSETDISNALLAGGLLGVFIAQEGGFAAEEGGCQYECGSASGMAAAALVELMGGNGQTALNAASMALQNTMGLICDPVANRVEVPCLGRNIMAALNAVAAANMGMAGFDHVIPAGEVIKAMKEVGQGMDSRFKCTCKGGLSTTKTSLDLLSK